MRTLQDIKKSLDLAYKLALKEALIVTGFNLSQMAIGLGISRTTAYTHLKKNYGKNFKKVLLKECIIPINTAEDVAKLTKDE